MPTQHFRERVADRIGPAVNPDLLWQCVRDAIDDMAPQARYLGRLDRTGRRAWQFTVDGRPWAVVVCHGVPLTVLPPDMLRIEK
jgi:hypothetical protein